MGLFDRFKKKTKAAADSNEITIQADSDEAREIIQKREEMLSAIEESKKEIFSSSDSESVEVEDEEWEDFSEEPLQNPFSKEKDKKSRKLAQQAEKLDKIKSTQLSSDKPIDRMKTTTGRKLIPVTKEFEMDLSKSTVNKGGQIIRGGPVLDEILSELEEELLQSDMGLSLIHI